jgi:hypothetical protein
MKKNDWLIIIATLAYSYLFYEQYPGINFFLFSVLLILFTFISKPTLIREPGWLLVAAGTLCSGFAVFYYSTPPTVIINIGSILLLGGYSFNPQSSTFISFFNSCFSLATAVPRLAIAVVKPMALTRDNANAGAKKAVLLMFPATVVIIFFFLYRQSSPLFANFTDQLSFSLELPDWILFTAIGLILMFSFFRQTVLKFVSNLDEKNPNDLAYVSEEEHETGLVATVLSRVNEVFTGVALFILLNLLLITVNGVDVYYLYIIQRLPQDLTLSEYLHDGTEALIFSIILAVGIIIFYFRGRLNFSDNNKTMRWLTYVWILQNIFLILTTAKRNYFYVSNFGLTHKRIGVYIFLALCVIGLITTLIKVMQVKSSWYLFRKNAWVWYVTLIVIALVNWNAMIAGHNLQLAKTSGKAPDYYYLGNLSYTSTLTLVDFYKEEKDKADSEAGNARLVNIMLGNYYSLGAPDKDEGWQSACYLKNAVRKQIDELIKNDKFFQSNMYYSTVTTTTQ